MFFGGDSGGGGLVIIGMLCFGLGYAYCRAFQTLIRKKQQKAEKSRQLSGSKQKLNQEEVEDFSLTQNRLSRLNSVKSTGAGNIAEYGPISPPSLQLCYGCDIIIPFSEYAACKLLDTTPDSPKDEFLFEGIRTMAALYLRVDFKSMSDCLEVYGLNKILFEQMKTSYYLSGFNPSMISLDDSDKEEDCDSGTTQQLKGIKWTLQIMLDEFEAMLCEYFSWHWDQIEDIYQVNQDDLSGEGLTCLWDPNAKNRVRRRKVSMTRDNSSQSLSEQSEGSANLAQDARAKKNWLKAKRVAIKKLTEDTLAVQRKIRTMFQILSGVKGSQQGDDSTHHSNLSSNSDSNHGSSIQNQASDINLGDKQQQRRNPVLLMLGGGMAAGKSTVREIIGKDEFWSKVGKSAVVVEADALKNQDVVYQSLNSIAEFEGADVSRMVHEYSTKAAEEMLVMAVNEQKDIVFDGTMTWLPFVEQTVAMVRDHNNNYKRGPGFVTDENGQTITERYWEVDHSNPPQQKKLPYRIELVGVTCDPSLAVARGIWRKLRTGRSVPIPSQLRSHKLFSANFEQISSLVDSATLYHTGSALTTLAKRQEDLIPKVIAHRSSATKGEILVNTGVWADFQNYSLIDNQAKNKNALFSPEDTPTGPIAPCCNSQCCRRQTLQQIFRRAWSESSFDSSIDGEHT